MKKLLIAGLVAGVLATAASAQTVESHTYIGLTGKTGTVTVSGTDYDENLGELRFGWYKVFSNNFMLGIDTNIEYGKVKDLGGENATAGFVGANLNLGYRILPKYALDVYVLGGGKVGGIESTQAAGWYYGAGVAKNLWNWGRVMVEYKKYDMTSENTDYDEDTVGLSVVFFRK